MAGVKEQVVQKNSIRSIAQQNEQMLGRQGDLERAQGLALEGQATNQSTVVK